MNNDIKISCDIQVGTGFIPPHYLLPGEDEYRIRDEQFAASGKKADSYRKLKPFELETLVRQDNTCGDWANVFVADPFTPELIHNSSFSGMVRIGRLERVSLEHHDLHLFAGISNSQIIACDIGDNCVINNCAYIAHYIIGDNCMLIDNAEVHVSNHSKFGNGNVVEGEGEDVRVMIDVMNEGGGRWVYPFSDMTCADAYLWARYRDKAELMGEFGRMTDAMFDNRRGRYGTIGAGSVLKSNRVIKDVVIGESAYIKGSNKLKNLTIKSKEEARTQIGEGVELVNGIIGYGCKIFYGCKAVRFVMCDNSSLKYGARLIHSVLGENSTVSCCEILNNLIFPAHEQHHNTSFLIASLVKGQSNMAAGATIGSNHNSRAPDGEIEAGRGFWPGLCTSVKHSSRFASFCLLSKGDYRYELDIPFPFCLVDNDYKRDRLMLVPGYWWANNMYALMRNEAKFLARDHRCDKAIHIEYSPFAPDTSEEIILALDVIEKDTGRAFGKYHEESAATPATEVFAKLAEKLPSRDEAETPSGALAFAKVGRAILSEGRDPLPFEVMVSQVENSNRECVLRKPARAWRAYREMLLWFAGKEVARFAAALPEPPTGETLEEALRPDEYSRIGVGWENLGGLLVSKPRLDKILAKAEAGNYATWREFHEEYRALSDCYPMDKARYAWSLLVILYPRGDQAAAEDSQALFEDRRTAAEYSQAAAEDSRTAAGVGAGKESLLAAFRDLEALSFRIGENVHQSRAKDWSNPFRKATFRSDAEMMAVLGNPAENSFVKSTRRELEALRQDLQRLSASL